MHSAGLNFDNTYLTLPPLLYAKGAPQGCAQPRVLIVNEELGRALGLDLAAWSEAEQARVFSGSELPAGAEPFSQAYAGHQFGNFTMLGDGRAHMVGEHVAPNGRRVDIQLKGAGRTPFSRRGDGLAAVSPMLREYLISEALSSLGVPTTRSLAVVSTGEWVHREQELPGAVLTRIAQSHLRVGTFEYAAATKDYATLSALLDYAVDRHYPQLQGSTTLALDFLRAVMEQQLRLVVEWMRIGFIHGVLNTDNVTISGESIDFGPCAFMDAYDPEQVFSSIDRGGRYAFGNQPAITQWNLARLAEALLPLMGDDVAASAAEAEALLLTFEPLYEQRWITMMRDKLGLAGAEDSDRQLSHDLLACMADTNADYTNTFRDLGSSESPTGGAYDSPAFTDWYARYATRRTAHGHSIAASVAQMQQANPTVIPRNHQVEHALTAGQSGDLQPLHALLAVLRTPYDATHTPIDYQLPPPASAPPYQTYCGT